MSAEQRIVDAEKVIARWFHEIYGGVKISQPSPVSPRHRGHRHNLRFGRVERRAKLARMKAA